MKHITLIAIVILSVIAGCKSGQSNGGSSSEDVVEDATLETARWELTTMNGEDIPSNIDPIPHVYFSNEESPSYFGGRSTCNSFFSQFKKDGGKVKFGAIGATEMYCDGKMELESEFFDALSQVNNFEINGSSLILYNSKGISLLEFTARKKETTQH